MGSLAQNNPKMSPPQSIWAQKDSQMCPGGGTWGYLGTFLGVDVPESSRVGTKKGCFVPDRVSWNKRKTD